MKKHSVRLSDLSDRAKRTEDVVDTAKAKVQSKWQDLRTAMDSHFTELRTKGEQHKVGRDLKRAERRADDPELDAAEAVDFAIYAFDYAESAIVARADVDDLETT
jgi:hypothetical protein